MFPAVPSVIPDERESPALLHPCCLVAALPGPKSPAAPSLMDHHGNGGAAPRPAEGEGLESMGQGSGLWRLQSRIKMLGVYGERLGALGTAGQGLVPGGTNFGAGIGWL